MNTSIVKVYDGKYGKWKKGAKVVLGWNGWGNLGNSKAVYTNGNGVAEINHSSTGSATIYVDGKNEGKMRTPGITTITI